MRYSLWLIFSLIVAPLWGADRPHFVWLVSEDNSVHYLEHYFAGGAETPRITQLAAHGLTFEHAFSTAPVCSVARTTLITGCYAPRLGTQYHRRARMVPMPCGLKMFPAYLREAGYYTANNQKKDYNAKEPMEPGMNRQAMPAGGIGRWSAIFLYAELCDDHESSLHFNETDVQQETTRTDPEKVSLAPYHPDTELFRYTAARYRDQIGKVDDR